MAILRNAILNIDNLPGIFENRAMNSPAAESKRVAVLGLGLIGATWARHFWDDGVLAACWNRTPRPEQPGWCADPAAAVAGADLVLICVADPQAVAGVLDLIVPALKAGKVVVQTSTIDPASSRQFQARVEATGASYLESPFTGSKPAAEQRQTVFFVGGPTAVLARVDADLARISRTRIPLADGTASSSLKLALNLQLAVMAEALVESLAFARQAGISDETYFACLRENVGWSGLAALKEPKLKAGDYSPQFSIKHMHKDVRLALAAADGLSLPATATMDQRFADAQGRGFAEEDFCAVAKLVT